MRVLYFGTYERDYPRNAQVIACLRRAGVDVRERHEGVWEGRRHKWSAGLGELPRLALAESRLARRDAADDFDVVVVGYPGQADLPAARRIARGRPVVFNPLVSLTDTLVEDRRRFRSGSLAARALRRLDRFALRAADLVVADTRQNADYLARLGRVDGDRIAVCFVGAEERLFRRGWSPPETFTALFVGKLIPLHGVETILAAARLAPELRFRVIGNGQLDAALHARPANVEWVPWIAYDELPAELHRAGCALGIFGSTAKAARVIPNKAFQALACGTPLVTADTPAARELLVDGESALLVPQGDPEALAAAVRRLANDRDLTRSIAARGAAVYHERASEDVLGARWKALLEAAARRHDGTHEWGTAPDFVGPRHALRERLLLDLLLDARPGLQVLDAGAGQGTFSRTLADRGFEVTSTDASEAALDVLRNRVRGTVARADVTALPFEDEAFDAVVLGEVLEHLEDDRAALREARRVLRPGGVVALSVPANPARFGPSDRWAGHVRRYTRERLVGAVEAAGLEVERCRAWGSPFSALYHRHVYERHLDRRGPAQPSRSQRPAMAVLGAILQLDRLFVGVERGALGYLLLARRH